MGESEENVVTILLLFGESERKCSSIFSELIFHCLSRRDLLVQRLQTINRKSSSPQAKKTCDLHPPEQKQVAEQLQHTLPPARVQPRVSPSTLQTNFIQNISESFHTNHGRRISPTTYAHVRAKMGHS